MWPDTYYQVAEEVAAFLNLRGNAATEALAETHLPVVTALVKGYTRGRGFDDVTGVPVADVAAVITSATARLMANPEQIPHDVGAVAMRGGFQGWTLPELAVLNRYRRRAA